MPDRASGKKNIAVFVTDASGAPPSALVKGEALALKLDAELKMATVDSAQEMLADADLIVVSDQDGEKRTDIQHIVRESERPVLVIRSSEGDAAYSRVLAAVDFSPASRAALLAARRLAHGAELVLVHVWHVPFSGFTSDRHVDEEVRSEEQDELQQLARAEEISGAWSSVQTQLVRGEVAGRLRASIDSATPNLVVLGSRGPGGLSRMVLGSVLGEMLRQGREDLLVVNP